MESFQGKEDQTAKASLYTQNLRSRFAMAPYSLRGKMRNNGRGRVKKEGPLVTARKGAVATVFRLKQHQLPH